MGQHPPKFENPRLLYVDCIHLLVRTSFTTDYIRATLRRDPALTGCDIKVDVLWVSKEGGGEDSWAIRYLSPGGLLLPFM